MTYEDGVQAWTSGDFQKAFEIFSKLTEQGHLHAQCYLAYMLIEGKSVPPDEERGRTLYFDAALKGDSHAQYLVAHWHIYGIGMEINYKKGIEWLEKAAIQNSVLAQVELGEYYEHGWNVELDLKQALFWYESAANFGSARANELLSYCYESGNGVPEDLQKALTYYQKAIALYEEKAEAGNLEAIQEVIDHCFYGRGRLIVPDGNTKAAYWAERAAEMGDATAQILLGRMYHHGRGVPRDDRISKKWFQKALDQGSSTAQFWLDHPDASEEEYNRWTKGMILQNAK